MTNRWNKIQAAMILAINLFLFIVVLTVVGCGVGSEDTTPNKAQLRQNKLVEELYGPLVGTYGCTITETDHTNEKARLIISITTVAVTNPDGTPGSKKSPLAIFQRIAPVVADYALFPSGYSRETATLNLSSNDKSDIESIQGQMVDRKYTGTIFSVLDGEIGKLTCQWETKDTGLKDTLRDRLFKAYRSVEGSYRGTIFHFNDPKKNIPVRIDLTALESSNKQPYLAGFYDRLDHNDADLGLDVTYRPNESPPQITFEGTGLMNYRINFSGTLEDGQIQATVTTKKDGYYGKFEAQLVSIPDPPPGDLFAEYLKIQGTYRGKMTVQSEGGAKSKIEVTLNLRASRPNGTPRLLAELRRSDLERAAKSVVATYSPFADVQALKVRGNFGPEIFELKGSVVRDRLRMQVQSSAKELGELILDKDSL